MLGWTLVKVRHDGVGSFNVLMGDCAYATGSSSFRGKGSSFRGCLR